MRNVVDKNFERRLAGLINSGERGVLRGGRKGVEKESLRVSPDGVIAQTRHPQSLGAPLTNEHITTDFSESLIELVTPPFGETWELLQYLCDIHQFVYRHLEDELLWATSMPSAIDGDASIPLAQFGNSNVGRMKTVYRHGLGVRYGRIMQAISGVHFNYSFSPRLWGVLADVNRSQQPRQDFVSEQYFGVLRNYRRYGWLVLYLFGTSPAVSNSFFTGRENTLPALDADTVYEPYGTSLRMSDIGYRNKNQSTLSVSVNSLAEYVRDLTRAIGTPYPPYEKIGVKVDGVYQQLNANILQIENEYYSYIRPKRIAQSGERPTKALHRAGVEYVEVRALDVSAFDPVGVNQNKLRFLEAFLALCLLRESAPIGVSEQPALDANHLLVARRGREPKLMLRREGRDFPMIEWARELLDSMQGLCEMLDHGEPSRPYSSALEQQRAKIDDVEKTPSARLLTEMRQTGESFFQLALRMSKLHKDYFLGLYPPNESRLGEFAAEAQESLEAQRSIEATDAQNFDAYLAHYLAD
ncbi:MAG TPA: glutamate--cysteine ligase [Steroidobacteraceae bacterium]|nr:glutamate--cysteine ligase [Steroidobacteraceae bacterium]